MIEYTFLKYTLLPSSFLLYSVLVVVNSSDSTTLFVVVAVIGDITGPVCDDRYILLKLCENEK